MTTRADGWDPPSTSCIKNSSNGSCPPAAAPAGPAGTVTDVAVVVVIGGIWSVASVGATVGIWPVGTN